jgi:hypothetical protein
MEKLPGVVDVISGYAGGDVENPTYKQVSSGKTGHIEVIQVTFDPKIVTYEQVLDNFFRHIDPTDVGIPKVRIFIALSTTKLPFTPLPFGHVTWRRVQLILGIVYFNLFHYPCFK